MLSYELIKKSLGFFIIAFITAAIVYFIPKLIPVKVPKGSKNEKKRDATRLLHLRYLISSLIASVGFKLMIKSIGFTDVLSNTIIDIIITFTFIVVCFMVIDILVAKLRYFTRAKRKTIRIAAKSASVALFMVIAAHALGIDIFSFLVFFHELVLTNSIVRALIIFIAFLAIAKSVLSILKEYVSKYNIINDETAYRSVILSKCEYPLAWILVFYGCKLALRELGLIDSFLYPLINTFIVIVVMATLHIVIDSLISYWQKRWHERTKSKLDDEMFLIAHNFLKILTLLLGIIFILVIWGLGPTLKNLLLSLSVIGVILGFALKDSFSNIFSGIALMLDRCYKTGDLIRLETGELGKVVKIGLRSTKLRTYDNEVITVPNAILATTKVVNYAQPDNNLRISIYFSVEYSTDIKKLKKAAFKSLKKFSDDIVAERTSLRLEKLGDFALEFRLLVVIKDYKKRLSLKSEITESLFSELKKQKIKIPYPIRTIQLKKRA